jgi:glycosyltransferase involved in cell wall biosynthesis
MRVLMVNLGYPPNTIGGAEIMVQSLARALVGRGVTVSVASLSQSGSNWQGEDQGVRAYFIDGHPLGNLLLDPGRTTLRKIAWHLLGEVNRWSGPKLAEIIAVERPDVIHTHSLVGLSVGIWRLARRRGIPIVHTLHDYQLLCPRGTMFRRGAPCPGQCGSCRVMTTRRRRASALPDTVIGISRFILSAHRERGYFPAAAAELIPNGVRMPACHGARREARVPLRIGFLGRLHPSKGIETLLAALAHLPRDRYRAKLAGSGGAEYTASLRRRAEGLSVEFLGWVPAEGFYGEIDVLVVPSAYAEPQGLVLIEAASFGVPVIYADRGGLGETGQVFPGFVAFDPAREDGLAQALAPLVDDPARLRRLSEAIGPVPAAFGIDAFVERYRQVYAGLCRGAAG